MKQQADLDLAGEVDGVPERFVPELYAASLIEAEHLNRYWWAAGLARGAAVLDAGCGVGYGTAILAQRSGAHVLGVDVAGAVLDAVRPTMPANVELQQADLYSLPHADASFDTVVCFELIEHVDEPGRVVKELARVLKPDGLLIISTPNADVSEGQNPHHHHEMGLDELQQLLGAHFDHLDVNYQSAWLNVAIFGADLQQAVTTAPTPLPTTKVQGQAGDRATYFVVLASQNTIEEPSPSAVMTTPAEFDQWSELWRQQREHIDWLEANRHELVRRNEELQKGRALLVQAQAESVRAATLEFELGAERQRAEHQLHLLRIALHDERVQAHELQVELYAERVRSHELRVEIHADRERLHVLHAELDAQRRSSHELQAVITGLHRRLDDVYGSTSWRVTSPMRRVTGRLRSRSGG